MKPHDNKKHYDAGRLRHKIQFWQDVFVANNSGGGSVTPTLILETFAGKDEVSAYTQSALNAGRSEYKQFQYFVIRNRKNFMPVKDMKVLFGENSYIVETVKELDDPCTFLKVLCVVSV